MVSQGLHATSILSFVPEMNFLHILALVSMLYVWSMDGYLSVVRSSALEV